ncbi:MAG TPA: LLM class flavin-dependent oxidoreductase [Thermodesulfobacteriota bacterium]|nr:LLM class flavin-dependent oxidoreductase [Thermodesulfobacteriota bacterium]
MDTGTHTKPRFDLWYDFRNPPQWRRPYTRIYCETLEQIVWAEEHGFDDVWLQEHHFHEDGFSPSVLPIAAAIAARTNGIQIGTPVLLLPLHNPSRSRIPMDTYSRRARMNSWWWTLLDARIVLDTRWKRG